MLSTVEMVVPMAWEVIAEEVMKGSSLGSIVAYEVSSVADVILREREVLPQGGAPMAAQFERRASSGEVVSLESAWVVGGF